jgi:hypothetical protein
MIPPSAYNMLGNIYQSQADTYTNSFANPMNPANMNPGFGMDPNLLTPSYTAGYRPQYDGPQPYNQYGRVGFFAGVNNILNPTSSEPRYGNPIDNNTQTMEGVSSRPFDSVVWAGQRIAAPALAFGAAFKYTSGIGAWAGRSTGRALGAGIASGMGGYMPGFVGRGLTGGLGAVGGLAGRLFLPVAVGQAAMAVGQRAIFNPYMNTRREARDLRDNFQGVTFDGAQGNAVTGQGLGFRESTQIAQQITKQGINDFSFSTGEYANIADYTARSGMLDDTKVKQISQRVKDVAEQVKLVMAIAGDPSIKNAIEEISKLHSAGASVSGPNSQASRAFMSLGLSAAVSGRSVQNIMNTVGAQGQYLYQANGMTPYLGQMAAANIIGSFDTARRNGILNTSQIARMGGVEGATQASLTAQVNGSQTLLNKMAMYNQYINGRTGSSNSGPGMSITNVTSQFGSDFSRDPMKAYGGMHLYSRVLGGKQMDERGSLALEDQITSILDSTATQRDKNGKYSAEQMAGVMSGVMGMSDDEIQAYIAQRTAESDPGTYRQGLKARNAQTQKQLRQYVSQNYLYGGAIGGTVRSLMKGGRNVTSLMGEAAGWFAEGSAAVGDATQSGADWLQFGASFGDNYTTSDMDKVIDSMTTGRKTNNQAPAETSMNLLNEGHDFFSGRTLTDLGRVGSRIANGDTLMGSDSIKITQQINALAKQGNKNAQAFINATDKQGRSKALGTLLKENKADMANVAGLLSGGGSRESSGNFDSFLDDVGSFGNHEELVKNQQGQVKGLMGDVVKTLGEEKIPEGHRKNFLDSVNAIGQVSDLANKIAGGASQAEIRDMLNSGQYDQVKGLVGGRGDREAVDYITDTYKRSVETGLGQLGNLAYTGGFNVDEFKKNPNRIQDKKQRDAFIAAMKSGDTATMENIVSKQLGYAAGGKLKTEGLKGATSQSLNDVVGFQQHLDLEGQENAKAYEKVASGRYDFATTQNILNNIDSKKNNEVFKAAVDKLDGAADKLGKAADGMGGSSSSGSGSSWSFLNPFNGTSDLKVPNNQRNNGSPK